MIVIGVLLLLVGYFTGIGILETLGLVLAAIGALLLVFGWVGSPVYGRRHWW